ARHIGSISSCLSGSADHCGRQPRQHGTEGDHSVRNEVPLKGCSTEPMAGYLKSLAVFRLVSEQADSRARGWWEGNSFRLESIFDESGLVDFFLDAYSPTPIVAPWNGGSGFGEGDRRVGIDAIMASNSPRLSEYRRTIRDVFSWPEVDSAEMTLSRI